MTSLRVGNVKAVFVLCFSLLMVVSLLPHQAFADPMTVVTSSTTLTADVIGSVVVGANGITLDCAGHNVSGIISSFRTSMGIVLEGRNGVTVENCQVTGFSVGIKLISSTNNTLRGNVFNGNNNDGIV